MGGRTGNQEASVTIAGIRGHDNPRSSNEEIRVSGVWSLPGSHSLEGADLDLNVGSFALALAQSGPSTILCLSGRPRNVLTSGPDLLHGESWEVREGVASRKAHALPFQHALPFSPIHQDDHGRCT